MRTWLLLLLCGRLTCSAATYYVATTGNDTTGDGSSGNPWLTIQKGINTASGGDTVFVTAGTYASATTSTKSGSAGNYIKIQSTNFSAYVTGDLNIDHSYYWIEGLKVEEINLDSVNSSHNVVVTNYLLDALVLMQVKGADNLVAWNTFTNCNNASGTVLLNMNSDFSIIASNVFTGNEGHDCIRAYGNSNRIVANVFRDLISGTTAGNGDHADVVQIFTTTTNAPSRWMVFERNIITNSEAQLGNFECFTNAATGGAIATNMHDFTFRNNLIINSRFQLNCYMPNVSLYHNTFVGSDAATGLRMLYDPTGKGSATGARIINNIFCSNTVFYSVSASLTDEVVDYNFVTDETNGAESLSEAHGITGSYTHADVFTSNWRPNTLIASAGTNLLSIVPVDYEGNARSTTPTLGAYQFFNTLTIVTNTVRGTRLRGLRGL